MRCFGLAVLAALALAGCSAPSRDDHHGPVAYIEPTAHVQVVAADLYQGEGATYRLANAVLPQPYPHARCWAEAELAAVALGQVRLMTAGGLAAHDLQPVGRDPDGALRATVAIDDGDLGDTLVGEGLAVRWTDQWDWCRTPPDPTATNAPALGPRLVLAGIAP